jgi:hypothetical protein
MNNKLKRYDYYQEDDKVNSISTLNGKWVKYDDLNRFCCKKHNTTCPIESCDGLLGPRIGDNGCVEYVV